MKICLFGGTFDPPHIGHLLVAQTICEAEDFDKIVFIPASKAPHKVNNHITAIDHRLSMLKLAIEDNPNFEISDIEITRGGVSYSLDTIREFKKQNGLQKDDIYFLIGSDSLKEFHTWYKPDEIMNECHVIVALRPGFEPTSIKQNILAHVQFANIPRFEVASTNIRKRWIESKTIRYMVTLPVWDYINEHKLYL
ncbi:MAG: nicotinate-nucleotide adenylyltransferase [Candidatus Marinimicrobia bacterium]|nr:nicotinate-nucleotide adenylyltransferase [Candidatus Neomarinimicrobiota bacterium]